jgi:uncharacterized protein (DUF486 family)
MSVPTRTTLAVFVPFAWLYMKEPVRLATLMDLNVMREHA